MKSGEHLWEAYLLQQKSEVILHQLESDITNHTNCIIPVTPAILLSKKSSEWWQLNTCTGTNNNINYYYAIEIMDKDECAIMNNDKSQTAQYYRITLKVLSNRKYSHYILQSTIAEPASSNITCQNSTHAIASGRQSIREI